MPRIHVGIRAKQHTEPALGEYWVKNAMVGREAGVKVEIGVSGNKTEFVFDQYFDDKCTQHDIFESCGKPVADEVLEGFNGSIFAYGQTGAGKTYTVSGPSTGDHDSRGLCSRTIDYLFAAAHRLAGSAISIKFSAIEIYNDVATDLLRSQDTKNSTKLLIMDSPGGILVPDLLLFPLSSSAEGQHKLYEANINRSVAEHQLNRQSSRSHAIYTFHITRTKSSTGKATDDEGDVVFSKLNLVDLAGSERIEKSGSTGGLAKEAAHINRSLTFLEQVVVALTQSKRDHIPYRQSKLTYLLKDSLGGNCNTYLIACIWTSANHGWETLSTLRFASRMKCIENTPIRNNLVQKDSSSSTRHLMNQIDALKKELAMRDLLCGKVEPWLADLSRPQVTKACKAMLKFVSSKPDNGDVAISATEYPEIHSLAEARFMLGLARTMTWDACGDNEAKIFEVTNKVQGQYLPQSGATIAVIREGAAPGDGEPVSHAGSVDDAEVTENVIPSSLEQTMATDVNNERSADTDQAAVISFDEFKVTMGEEVQKKYESAKNEVKVAKEKQRRIVRVINTQKGEIDKLNELIQKYRQEQDLLRITQEMPDLMSENTISKGEYDNALPLIEAAKKAYRDAHSELGACKKELEELHLAKKKCLSEVVAGYEDYCQSMQKPPLDS